MQTVESRVVSRRDVLRVAGIGFGAAVVSRRRLLAGNSRIVPTMVEAAAKAEIHVRPIRRSITLLEGSGGNIAVLSGLDGKLLVDGGFRMSEFRLREALAGIDGNPIQYLINTHWHTDHTDSNEWLHAAGATIIAHENTSKRLSVATRVEGWEYTFPASPAAALPAKVFASDHQMHCNATQIRLKYYMPAHTDSDIYVHFTEADVLHVGDTWWNGVYPFIDYSTGGSIDGSIRAAETNIETAGSNTIVIPGHGEPGNKADLIEFRDMLVAIRQKVSTLKKQGRSLEETVAAKPTAAYDAKWGQFLITPAMFTGLVYMGV